MSMNAAELAALIAAVFWALLVCVGVFVLIRLGRLLSESSKLVADEGAVAMRLHALLSVMARQADMRNYYYLTLRSSNTLSLRKLVDGVATPLSLPGLGVRALLARRRRHDDD